MRNRKKATGPITESGKAKVAKNAIKHNLSSPHPTTDEEQELIAKFSQELIAFYKTDDPLEILQLQRIALYRAKLARVYEAEKAAAQLARQDLDNNPKQVLDRLTHLHDVSKGMILEYFNHQEFYLPCALMPDGLAKICGEINRFYGTIQSDEDFDSHLPALAKFLQQFKAHEVTESARLDEKLAAVAKRLQRVFEEQENYHHKYHSLIEEILSVRGTENEEGDAQDDEIEEVIRINQAKYQKAKPANASKVKQLSSKPYADATTITLQLNLFIQLQECFLEAQGALSAFASTKNLLVKIQALPNAQSEVLMRYQTNWERRLSAAIGEFLALQRRNAKPL